MCQLNFNKGNGLIPVVIQEASTNEVLMLGFMNQEAWKRTQQEGRVWFYSRTRNTLWMKGETSGNTLLVVSVAVDCDRDALLIRAVAKGSVCHLGTKSCFKDLEEAQND